MNGALNKIRTHSWRFASIRISSLSHLVPSARISLTLSRHLRIRQVLWATPRILTKLLCVGSSWSPCICSAIWRGPSEYVTYELIPTSPAVSSMSGLSNLDSFRDGCYVAVQLLLCRVLPSGPVQYCSQHSCVVSVKLFLL